MVNAGLSTTLSHNSFSKEDFYGLFACLAVGMMPFLVEMSAFHILWHTKWYERLVRSEYGLYVIVPSSHLIAIGQFLRHLCTSLGLFFLIYNFQYTNGYVASIGKQVHLQGNFSWVVGWLVASIGMSVLVPVAIHASCNLFWAAFPGLFTLAGLAMAFSYEFVYLTQNSYPQLQWSTPAPWLLIWPIVAQIWATALLFRAAIISTRDAGYMEQCARERGMISDFIVERDQRWGEGSGDMDHVVAKRVLAQDTQPVVPVTPAPAPAALPPPRQSAVTPLATVGTQARLSTTDTRSRYFGDVSTVTRNVAE